MGGDLLGGHADAVFATFAAFFRSPVEHLGWPLMAASVAVGLALLWVRRGLRG